MSEYTCPLCSEPAEIVRGRIVECTEKTCQLSIDYLDFETLEEYIADGVKWRAMLEEQEDRQLLLFA